jgi:hypothetical protein
MTIDCCGNLLIDPVLSSFLAAMKLICYGVSFSAFKDYYQMRESTAKLFLENFVKALSGVLQYKINT